MKDVKTSLQTVELDTSKPVWDRCFMVAPLVLVGTKDEDGTLDLAPKHMAFPMGWQNYFGFVCSPSHHTYINIDRCGEFTVSYTRPSQVLYASLAASPRYANGKKSVLQNFATFPARKIDGEFILELRPGVRRAGQALDTFERAGLRECE